MTRLLLCLLLLSGCCYTRDECEAQPAADSTKRTEIAAMLEPIIITVTITDPGDLEALQDTDPAILADDFRAALLPTWADLACIEVTNPNFTPEDEA